MFIARACILGMSAVVIATGTILMFCCVGNAYSIGYDCGFQVAHNKGHHSVDAPPRSLRYSELRSLEVVCDSFADADCQFRRGHHLN